jgi:hypothetical protein
LQSDALQNSRCDQGPQALPPLLQGFPTVRKFPVFLLAKFTLAFSFSAKQKQSTARFRQK